MPFRFSKFEAEIRDQPKSYLESLKKKYTAAAAGSPVSAGLSVLLGPLAPIGIAMSLGAVANASAKLAIIDNELERQGQESRYRVRDFARGVATAGAFGAFGHGVSHVANHILGPTHDILSEGYGLFHEKNLEYCIDRASEDSPSHLHTNSLTLRSPSVTGRRICDGCYTCVEDGLFVHCDDCADFDYCFACFSNPARYHTSGHTFTAYCHGFDVTEYVITCLKEEAAKH